MGLDIAIEGLSAYILVFCRVGGMIFFNPLLSRRSLPSQFRVALVLGITLLLTPMTIHQLPQNMGDFEFVYMMLLELLVGLTCGFVFQLFYYLLFTAGDIIDMGFGLAMAKVFNPTANIQVSTSGSFFEIIFVLYIFATNCHLVFIRLIFSSYDLVSMGGVTFGIDVIGFVLTLFSSVFMLIIQLAIPFMAATFVLEISMGVLMKLVPQINVFVIHFQLKILAGMLLMFLFAFTTSNFMLEYIDQMFRTIENLLRTF